MIVVYITACIIFLFAEGVFSASEIAFVSSSALKLRHRIHRGQTQARIAFEIISKPEKFLATAMVGTNISVVVSSSLATLCLIRLGIENSNFWITVFFTPAVVIFAELIPKNIGRFYREEFSCRMAPVVRLFESVFFPAVSFIERASRFLIRIFLKKKQKRSFYVTREEIKSIIGEIESQGILDKGEKEAIEDIFDFRETKIKDVLTLIKEVVGIDCIDSHAAVLKKIRKYGLTRYPVFRNKEVIGYLNVFDLFYGKGDWLTRVRPIVRVDESQQLQDVFTHLKATKENIALVMRGKHPLGIVTLEDMMREIVTSIIKTTPSLSENPAS